MCSSSIIKPVTDAGKKVTGVDYIERKALGGQSFSDVTGLNPHTPKIPTAKVSDRKPLAIGTQTGGTRKPLGSTSGLNT